MAIQENEVAFWLYRSQVAGWQTFEDDELLWYVSGRTDAMDNGVLRTRLSPERADARIAQMQSYFGEQGLPFTWWGGPARTPADLAARLESAGFVSQGDDPGMAADLHTLREDLPVAAGLAIERIADDSGLAGWVSTLRVANDRLPLTGPLSAERILLNGPASYAPSDSYRLYLARLDGKAVATSAVFLGDGVAGVYCVGTIPRARRQGIASAVTLAGLREARAEGYRVGVLGASSMGYGVYRRLGFEQYCTLQSHTWPPRVPDDFDV
jgi:ribosomal protein S18 acetylase RimI-like enzyme